MSKKKNILKTIIFFIIIIFMILNISDAMSINNLTGYYDTNTDALNELKEVGNKGITVASTIGSVLSVVAIIVIGIKYMLGSAAEKADYKKTLLPFFIGAIFIFAASTIASIMYNIAINLG